MRDIVGLNPDNFQTISTPSSYWTCPGLSIKWTGRRLVTHSSTKCAWVIHESKAVQIHVHNNRRCLGCLIALKIRTITIRELRMRFRVSKRSDWRSEGRGFDPLRVRQHSFVKSDHEIFSTVILSFPRIQEGPLSVFGERMFTNTG